MSDKGKRFFSLLLVSALASTVLVGCSSQKTATQSSQTLQDKVNQFVSEVSGAVSDLQESLSAESSAVADPNSGTLVESNKTSGDFTYDVYSDHIVVTAYTGKSVKVEIPAEIDGLPVTVVKGKPSKGFDSAKAIVDSSVVSVTLPDALLMIGDYSFYKSNVKTINIPDGVVSIGDYAFYEAEKIEELKLPSKLTTIGERAFYKFSPIAFGEKLIIPDGVKVIPDYAFQLPYASGEETLKELVISDTVQSIGEWAFEGHLNLEKVTIGKSVSSIGEVAFEKCGITSLTLPEGVTLGKSAFRLNKSLQKVIIPKNTQFDGTGVFGDSGIEEIEVHSERVTSSIFGGNRNLKNVILSDEVVSVEERAFSMNYIEGSLSIHISDSVEFLDDNFISDLDADKLTIYGKKGSEAEKFAKKNSVKFVEE